MKKLLPIIALYILASCEGEKEEIMEEPQPFTFSTEVDTVQIDFKDNFYFMGFYLATSTVSPDKKKLYNLNSSAPNLEIIDLDKLELIKIEDMDKEGPLGIGRALTIKINSAEELMIQGDFEIRIFDASRTKQKKVKIDSENLSGDVLTPDERYEYTGVITDDGSHYYVIYRENVQASQGEIKGLALINLSNSTIQKIPIPSLDRVKNFIIAKANTTIERGEKIFVTDGNNKAIASTSAFNDAFVYDIQKDTLIRKEFHSQLTADAKKGNYRKVYDSEEERKDIFKERSKEVEFGKFLYDEQNEKFWRFSYEMDRMIGDSLALKTVLTIFDADLNQLHEERVAFDYSFSQSFFKEGMLYSYINLNDEMAFIRVKPTYKP